LAKECTFKPVTGRAPSNPRLRAAQAGTSFAERAMEYQAKVRRHDTTGNDGGLTGGGSGGIYIYIYAI
jgi:hypothetical protein